MLLNWAYGRHFSFLKAIAAIWQKLYNPKLKATFKIDLDQVFDQPKLLEQTGKTALQHLCTPLWGAKAQDDAGNIREFGLLAGALVNESDINQGLFTPDIIAELEPKKNEDLVFSKNIVQAASTEAEMMVNYPKDSLIDGANYALERIHVTGGTTGIRINSLFKYRPFTASFMGRAEDQAYMLSIIDNGYKAATLHASGLIMRHDKDAFAAEAIQAAKLGKVIGDLERIILFTGLAKAMNVNATELHEVLDPFTGAYITDIPYTLVHLLFCLKALELDENDAEEILTDGCKRLKKSFIFAQNRLSKEWKKEKQEWNLFYDTLEQSSPNPQFTEILKQVKIA